MECGTWRKHMERRAKEEIKMKKVLFPRPFDIPYLYLILAVLFFSFLSVTMILIYKYFGITL